MAFDWVELVRVIHILGAVVWAGGAIFALVIVGPGVKAAGEVGQKFMQALGKRGGPARLMGPAGIVTVLAGMVLYWQYGYHAAPFADGRSTVLTLGAIVGLVVLVVGMGVGMPMQKRMGRIAKSFGPTGPTSEQAAEMQRLGKRVGTFGMTFSWLLVLALVLMVSRNLFA